MLKIITFFLLCLFVSTKISLAQVDNKKRNLVVTANSLIYGTGIVAAQNLWYKNFPKSPFHFFNDTPEWGGMDKIGHATTTYWLSKAHYETFRWAGFSDVNATILAASTSFTELLGLELLDAYNQNWGFSLADLAANAVGSFSFLLQQKLFKEQKVFIKFSYLNSPYARYRPQVLGKSLPEKVLKDYNGQVYWLCSSPFDWFQKDNKLSFLQVAIGYSIDGYIFGRPQESVFNGLNIIPKKQVALSLAVNWSKLALQEKWKKRLFWLNAIKLPSPSVYWTGSTCYFGFF